ncbi:alpha/beta hydrolase [Legionella sp. W05-934-2]|jgi:carboxylesterase|uniref:alpha/beta hydrolase n=1 Tax=Legionella sp. W05-934-2 TaxID=1198649 RepID=UPI003461A54B
MKQQSPSVDHFAISLQDAFNPADFRWFFQGQAIHPAKATDERLVRTVDIDNGNQSKALLMIHGYSSTPAVFRHLYPYLTNYDRIIIPRLPGHGRSIASFANSNASEWIASAEAYALDLLSQYKQVDIMGLSLGGLIATMLSQRLPFNHAYLLAPALNLTVNITYSLAFSKLMDFIGFHQYRAAAGSLHQKQHLELAYRRLPMNTVKEILNLINHYEHHPLQCPADLLLGVHDKVVQSDDVAQRFHQDNKTTIHWLENSGHVLPLDGDLAYIIDLVNS